MKILIETVRIFAVMGILTLGGAMLIIAIMSNEPEPNSDFYHEHK